MKKLHKLVIYSFALYAAMASSAACAESRSISSAEPDRRATRTTEQARKDDVIDTKSLVGGNEGKISTQGLERARKAETNKKLLKKQRAENRAREDARAKHKDKCKGCPDGAVYDQSSLFNK